MSWTESVTDRWSSRSGGARLLVRFVGVGLFAYLLTTRGAFTGPLWVGVLTAVALALSYVLMFLRLRRRFDRGAVILTGVMMLSGALVNPWTDYTGSLFCVLGGVVLVGQPELSVRVGLALVAAATVVLLGSAEVAHAPSAVLLSTVLGALAAGLLGLNRRQQVARRRQEQALATQTERTRRESARAAALEERGRIARDLHDVLAHSLGGLVVQLAAVEAELAEGRTTAATARLHASRQLAVDGLREARAAVVELRAEGSSDGPDADPTAAVLAALRGPVGVQLGAELDVVGEPRPVPPATVDALVSTVREALTNVNKHAPASRAVATLLFAADEVRVEVVNAVAERGPGADNGLAGTGAGVGLAGLATRVRAAGGEFRAGPEGGRWVVSTRWPQRRGTSS